MAANVSFFGDPRARRLPDIDGNNRIAREFQVGSPVRDPGWQPVPMFEVCFMNSRCAQYVQVLLSGQECNCKIMEHFFISKVLPIVKRDEPFGVRRDSAQCKHLIPSIRSLAEAMSNE